MSFGSMSKGRSRTASRRSRSASSCSTRWSTLASRSALTGSAMPRSRWPRKASISTRSERRMTEALSVGFVGIGRMGWPMARNVAAAGFPTWVYDADPARAERFAAECGGHAAASLEAVGSAADLVVTMLPTGKDVRAVVLGSAETGRGLAATLREGAVIVDMSSSDPLGTRELGAELRARRLGLIDAPVSGLVAKAETGTLTIMIGADDEAALASAEPVLRVLGERLVRTGALGCGHAMKALNNVVAATAFTVTAEALIVGKRFGLDPA